MARSFWLFGARLGVRADHEELAGEDRPAQPQASQLDLKVYEAFLVASGLP